MQIFGISDVGRKRSLNEDNFMTYNEGRIAVAIVCDGMGGAKAGEVASRITCRNFMQNILPQLNKIVSKTNDKTEIKLAVDRAISAACDNSNSEVFEKSTSDKDKNGMGTTIAGCVIIDDNLWSFHIGDSRVYQVTDEGMKQLTVDHSYVQSLVDKGTITEEEAKNHPYKNVILRAVGVGEKVECDICFSHVEKGFYLICSDGLSNYYDETRFFDILTSDIPLSDKADELVSFANFKGGLDNITAVIIDTER